MKFYLYRHQRTILWGSFAIYLSLVLALLLSSHWVIALVTHLVFGFILTLFNEWYEEQLSESEDKSSYVFDVIGAALFYIIATCIGPIILIALDLLEHCKSITARQVISASDPSDD